MGVISRSLLILVLVFIAGMVFVHYGSDFLGSLTTIEYLGIGALLIAVGSGLTLLYKKVYKGTYTTIEILFITIALAGCALLAAPMLKGMVQNCFEDGGVRLSKSGRTYDCLDSNGKEIYP